MLDLNCLIESSVLSMFMSFYLCLLDLPLESRTKVKCFRIRDSLFVLNFIPFVVMVSILTMDRSLLWNDT